jgi:hypothetical protein
MLTAQNQETVYCQVMFRACLTKTVAALSEPGPKVYTVLTPVHVGYRICTTCPVVEFSSTARSLNWFNDRRRRQRGSHMDLRLLVLGYIVPRTATRIPFYR